MKSIEEKKHVIQRLLMDDHHLEKVVFFGLMFPPFQWSLSMFPMGSVNEPDFPGQLKRETHQMVILQS